MKRIPEVAVGRTEPGEEAAAGTAPRKLRPRPGADAFPQVGARVQREDQSEAGRPCEVANRTRVVDNSSPGGCELGLQRQKVPWRNGSWQREAKTGL